MQEVLDLSPAAKRKRMLTPDPTQIVGKRVVLPIPHALARLLCVHVDGHHSIRSAFTPDLQPRIAERRINDLDFCSGGNPRPPVAQPIKMELINEIGR